MRPLNNATIRVSRASPWRSAIRQNAASLLRRATRRDVSGCARPCRQPSRCGNAPNSCLSRQGSTFYREVSKQIHAIFKDYTPLVEPLSLDEAYLDVTDNLKGIPTAWETAKTIRARIYDEIGLTASAGISCNKFLAKLASDYRKPNGQFAIMPDDAQAFVPILSVAKFHGVGPKTAVKMRALGIETGADLARQPFLSCRTTSASQGVGTTTSREVGTTGQSNQTTNESRRDRRRLFQRT
jgi:hypothetical protein